MEPRVSPHDYGSSGSVRLAQDWTRLHEGWESQVTWAVTVDFHNTIARCNEWFQLEVFDLIPAYLEWRERECGGTIDPGLSERGREHYRLIRNWVMESGLEKDAATCVVETLEHLGLPYTEEEVERGLEAIFRPTLEGVEPMPGIISTVRQLHECSAPMMVVSSAAYHPFLEWTLERFEIDDCFESVLTSADCGHYKSSPRIYELAAEMLGRRPETCIHIGDSERFDIRSAQQAGMRAVLIDWDGEMAGKTAADLRVETLCGLPDRLVSTFGCSPDAV